MRSFLILLLVLLFGCAQNVQVGNPEVSALNASYLLHAGQTTRGQAYVSFGAPSTISHTDQILWPYAGQTALYPAGTREIWSYYVSSVEGLQFFSRAPLRSHRQLIHMFFDDQGVLSGWDAVPLSN